MPGGYHTCTVRSTDATVACWGTNTEGQAQVPGDLGPVQALGAGTSHTCAIRIDGTLRCWGRNTEGQTTAPSDLGEVIQVDGGVAFTCALKADGTVRCWGSNIDQNTNPAGQSNVPSALVGVRAIAVGFYHVCAVRSGGALTCWGYNADGQAASPPGLGSVEQIGATYHDCALQAGGALRCWGFNGFGQTNVPAALGNLERVAVGGYHTCVLRTEGTISCWGLNQFGELEVPVPLRPATLLAQTITFSSTPPDPALPGGTYSLQAIGGGSGSPVLFSSLTTGICTVSGATVTFVSGGTCTVAADQAGNGSFAAAQATQSFAVGFANRAPVASAGGPYAAAEGAELSFDGSASTDPDGNAVSFQWAFGDGGTMTTTDPAVKPTHVYADDGSYVVTLTVTDAGGLTASATAVATITNVAPTGEFVRPATAPENAKLVLSLASVTDPARADVLQYAFDCGDGKGYGALTTTDNRPCTPADNGTLAVKAKVQDDDGGLTEYTGSIMVTNVAPTATFTVPTKAIPEGSTFPASLTKASDAAGDLPTLAYSITCQNPFGIFPTPAPSTSCLAYDNVPFSVVGRVSDKDGGQTSYVGTVTITNVAPSVVINSITVGASRTVTLTYTISDPAGATDMLNFCSTVWTCGTGFYTELHFGDTSTLQLQSPSQATTRTVSHTYVIAGTYIAAIRVRDKDGGITAVSSAKFKVP
jgi:hypothetical protein